MTEVSNPPEYATTIFIRLHVVSLSRGKITINLSTMTTVYAGLARRFIAY